MAEMSTDENTSIRGSDGILATVGKWVESNADRIHAACDLKGGWEGWAQVELAMALRRDHGLEYDTYEVNETTREDRTYKQTARRSDLMIRNLKNGAFYVIELKCESKNNASNFPSDMEEDMDKVTAGLSDKFRPAVVWCIGVAPSTSKNTDKLKTLGLTQYQIALSDKDAMADSFPLVWYAKYSVEKGKKAYRWKNLVSL